MKKSLLLALAATATTLVAAPPVQARDGCGRGYHQNRWGRCVLNREYRRDRVVLTVGQYYPGQGYWDGRRYWRERYRYHHGWRYR
jgi:hypothetical protein